jgi:hypothetical protein
MKRLTILVAAVLVAGTAGIAAEPEYSTRETRAITHAYAKCVVARRPAKASEALLRNIDNPTFMREYPTLIIGECLTRQTGPTAGRVKMTFAGDLYRYALADALVNRELATVAVPDLSAVPRLDHRDPGPPPQPVAPNGRRLSKKKYETAVLRHKVAQTYFYLSRYGECVVRQAPNDSRALLLTVPDSPEETDRFAALQPALGTCLPEGTTLKFGRVALRGSIAVNYYRLVRTAIGAPARGSAE